LAADVIKEIHELERFGSVLGLDRLRELLHRLGDPQEGMKYIHIAGTNGKGSVVQFLEEGLMGCGYRVGIYISPYIEVFNERIQINGEYIRDEDLDRIGRTVLDEIKKMTDEGLASPTEFEAVMAMAFLYFSEAGPDIVILETGLGGIGDATNVIRDPMICAITSVSFDHMDVLGDSLAEIAANKAGIIKDGAPVVSNVAEREAAAVIARKAYESGSRLYDISGIRTARAYDEPGFQTVSMNLWGTDYSDVDIPMAGKHQAENLKTALAVIEVLRKSGDIRIERSRLYEGLKKAMNPGRFEMIEQGPPAIVIDGAHNDAGTRALGETVKELFPDKRILVVTGMLRDKEVDPMLANIRNISSDIIVTTVNNPRAMTAEELAQRLETQGICPLKKATTPEDSIRIAKEMGGGYDLILFAGSLYLIGEIRRRYRDEERQS